MSTSIHIRILIGIIFFICFACQHSAQQEAIDYQYFNIPESDTLKKPILHAITDEDFLQYGVRVAYVDLKGDTIIPFGKYAYFGTDTLEYYANVIEHPNDSTYGRQIGIDHDQRILFDLVMFDNGPEPFHEGLIRVIRNGKMGFANERGRVVIPCIYEYAKKFENGQAQVTFHAIHSDFDEHPTIKSDEWFTIDKEVRRIND